MTGSNRRPSASQADALPAELILQVKMVTRTGFEPVNACVKGRCVNHFTNGPHFEVPTYNITNKALGQ